MRLAPLLAVLLSCMTVVPAQATPRRIDFGPPASQVAFRAYGLGLLPIDGTFAQFTGSLNYDPDRPGVCQVELRVEVASLVADDGAARGRITGPEFMDAARYPSLRYTGRCQPPDDLQGMLDMHGVTRPFTLSLDWDWDRDRVVAEGRLLRADWGMTALPLLGGRTVRIRVSVPLAAQSSHGG
jgi:polyisoprenoid-binding protein YceI